MWLQRHVLGGGERGRGGRDGRGELTVEGAAVGEEEARPSRRDGRPGPRLSSVVLEWTRSRQGCEMRCLLWSDKALTGHVQAKSLRSVTSEFFATPWVAALQAPLSMEFSWQEYRSGLPLPPPGDLPDPGIKPASPALAGSFFTAAAPGTPSPFP